MELDLTTDKKIKINKKLDKTIKNGIINYRFLKREVKVINGNTY